eukprot:5111200-Prymnesium_polylepis.1
MALPLASQLRRPWRATRVIMMAQLVAATTASPWVLRLLPVELYPEALCLDGSRPGYYYRRGSGADAGNIRLHVQGGNWCMDADDCLGRSRTFLGSSALWPAVVNSSNSSWAAGWDMGIFGLMSADQGPLRDWSAVWFMYCDGSSFTSHTTQPLLVNGTHVHMRGRSTLRAILDDLTATRGLAAAQTVLLAGTSSGGMACYYHAEHIRERLPATVRLLAAPDAGFFPDAPLPPGQRAFREAIKGLVTLFNISASSSGGAYPGTNAHCVAAHAAANETWRCLFAEYALPHIKNVPFFIVNSQCVSARESRAPFSLHARRMRVPCCHAPVDTRRSRAHLRLSRRAPSCSGGAQTTPRPSRACSTSDAPSICRAAPPQSCRSWPSGAPWSPAS